MNDSEPTPSQLLAALKRDDSPSEADRERLRSRVWGALGASAVAAGAASLTSKAAAAAPKTAFVLGPVGKLGVVLGLVGSGAVFVSKPWEPAPAARDASYVNAPRENSVPVVAAVSANETEAVAAPEVAQPVPGAVNDKSGPTRARPGSLGLDAEVSLLRAAQQALQAGRYPEALAKLAEHAQRFPRGVLRNEREASRAIALCQGGQSKSGQGRARDYLRANADSPLAARVKSACKLE
jgi:hypothetical protein